MPNATAPRPPRIPTRSPVRRTDATGATGADLLDGDSYAAQRYDRADLRERDLRHTSFSECAFVGVDLGGANLTGAHLVESELTELEAAHLTAPRSLWRHSTVQRSRLGAVEAYEAGLDGLLITDTKISYLNARSSTWKDVLLRGCVVDELDLVGATLSRVRFEDCRIGSLELTGATCTDVDLRTAELRSLGGLDGLRGCVISPGQLDDLAGILAAHLGIVVADA